MIKVANFLKNADKIELSEVREILANEAFRRLKFAEIQSFEEKYKATLINYLNDDRLSISSQNFELDQLPSFYPWRDELIAQKDKYMPLIVTKMLAGDALSYSIYEAIYTALNKPELLLSFSKIMNDKALEEAYFNSEGGIAVDAALNAEYWLNSDEGREVLCASIANDHASLDLLIAYPCV